MAFENLFPGFVAKCAELHELLQMVAYLLFIVGTIVLVLRGFSSKRMLLHFVGLLVLTSLLAMLPSWGNQIQSLLQNSVLNGLGVDPQKVQDQYDALLVVHRDTGANSWWDRLGDLNAFTIETLISGVLWLLGYFASLLLFWAYIIQKFILFSGYALSPMLIGLMAIAALRAIGMRYLMQLVGVLLWPLGWAAAALITQGMLDFMTDPSTRFLDPSASLYTAQATFGLAVIAFWIVFSTVSAPIIIQQVVSSGVLAGGKLIGEGASSFLQSARSSVGNAVMLVPGGLSLVTAGVVTTSLLTSISTAAGRGIAGEILSAGRGLPARRSRAGAPQDLSGDQAVRDLIAKTRGNLY